MKLYEHQEKIIKEDKTHTGLWLGTGSGKTRIALMLAVGKTLVIAPKTQVEDKNWNREGASIEMEKPYVSKITEFVCISKETFRRDWAKLPQFDTVIIDEAHTCLGVTANVRWIKGEPIPKASQLFDILDRYLQVCPPKRLYLCTATIIRSPMTVWAAAKLLGKNWSWSEWRDVFYIRLPIPGRNIYTVRDHSVKVKDRLARAVQKLGYTGQLSDYFDVPEQTYKVDYLDLTAKQEEAIERLSFDYPDPLVLLGKTHQVENGILSGDEFNAPQFFDNAKIDKLEEYAIEFPKMIVFAKYRAQIDQIGTAMTNMGKNVIYLTGDTRERGHVISEANKLSEYVFIVQSQISAGWELPDCPVMIFASMSYSVVDRIQGEGRILRANKLKKNLYIDLVMRGGVDEAVCKSIQNKQDFNERIYLKL